MNNQVRPKTLVYHGTIEAAGYLFVASWLSESEMRRRAIALWQPDAKVYCLSGNLFLELAKPQRTHSSQSLGLPLVKNGKHFLAFPVSPKELQTLADHRESIVFWQNGQLEIGELAMAEIESIETWFDISDFAVATGETLGVETQTASTQLIVMREVSEKTLDVRAELETVPTPNSEMSEILKVLRQAKENQSSALQNIFAEKHTAQIARPSFFTNSLAAVKTGLSDLFATLTNFGKSSENGDNQRNQADALMPQTADDEPTWAEKLRHNLRQLTVKAVVKFRMAQFFGKRQAEYLHKMMNLFEAGDLNEALRYAIPLEDMQALIAAKKKLEPTVSLGIPRPRSALNINPREGYSSSSINLETEWFEHLRKLYRASFERLVAQNRIEEAAFVLAELLRDNQEAVAFLEKHGRLKLAAELAEARNLPKEMIVRQWFLAGEKTRAVRLAILYNCFEYAVTKLEKENKERGAELREIWAETLAAGGNFAAAIDVLWPLADKRDRAREWIEKVLELGGSGAARMLARQAAILPEEFSVVREKVLSLLAEETVESAEKRVVLARELLKVPVNDAVRTLARPVSRAVLRDVAVLGAGLSGKEFNDLVAISRDDALRTDLPAFPAIKSANNQSEVFEFRVAASDQGASEIRHAIVLPDGKIAIALGEAGIKLLSASGKMLTHFDQPAAKFVLSDNANRAIALIGRGAVSRLTRLDFVERRARHWCEAKIDAFAPDYNGNLWFVGVKDEFYAIDATTKDFEAVWRVPDVNGAVVGVARSNSVCKFLTFAEGQLEKWTYQMPNLFLRGRAQTFLRDYAGDNATSLAVASAGSYSIIFTIHLSAPPGFSVFVFEHEKLLREINLPADVVNCDLPEISGALFVVTSYTKEAARIELYDAQHDLTASFLLEAAQRVATSLNEQTLTIADDCGRILVFDCRNKFLRLNLRH